MTVPEGLRKDSCKPKHRRTDAMEVVDSPLNLAHQQCRKAERLVSAGKYEEAISCHAKAADLLTEAMKTTECEQARLSLELQRDSHIKQQRLVQERWKREARRKSQRAPGGAALSSQPQGFEPPSARGSSDPSLELGGRAEREYDTLLYQFQIRQTGNCLPLGAPLPGSKTAKDDKTRLEEQQTTIDDLRQLVDYLMTENQRLTAENQQLRSENARLHSEAADFVEHSDVWVLPQGAAGGKGGGATGKSKDIAIPRLPPLEMPAQEDLCLDDLPPLELPEDIQSALKELLYMDKQAS